MQRVFYGFILTRLEPLLYESLYLNRHAAINDLLAAKSREFLERTVKTVFIGDDPLQDHQALQQLFSACSRVDQVFVYIDIAYNDIGALRPRHLAANYSAITGMSHNDLATLPLFSHVTHLQLYGSREDHNGVSFALLPCLTHLGLNVYVGVDMPMVVNILKTCAKLDLLLLFQRGGRLDDMVNDVAECTDDPRVVLFNEVQRVKDDWADHINGVDIWEKACRGGCRIPARQPSSKKD